MRVKQLKSIHIPQSTFSLEIENELNHIRSFNRIDSIVDCPCGSGAVTIPLIKKFNKTNFYCYDISKYEIKRFTDNIQRQNLEINFGNIFDKNLLREPCDVWLLVNSLFLLDDLNGLFLNLKKSSIVIVIIPNIHSNAYKKFNEENIGVNKHSLTADQVSVLFKNNNFSEFKRKDISYMPRTSNKKLWSVIKYFTIFDRLPLRTGLHQYTLLTFKNEH